MNDTAFAASDSRVGEILAIVARETAVDLERLRPEATIDELGIPSLDMAQTLFALESHFDVEIPVVSERAGAEFATVSDLVEHVLATLNAKRAKAADQAA